MFHTCKYNTYCVHIVKSKIVTRLEKSRLYTETTIYTTTIQIWMQLFETTFYVDYYKGLVLSQFQSHKLVSIPFRVN